ncbi:MAG: SpvB/TcaC N-terminal domain-containing protein [Paludibacter sp.]
MVKHFKSFFCCLILISLSTLTTYSQIKPVVFSEIFYDSPLEEDERKEGVEAHHNGEFIELFNPNLENIDLTGWKIFDKGYYYTFPQGTIILSRKTLLLAYRYPNTNFTLNSLFPSINTLQPTNIVYHDVTKLNNNGEVLRLFNKNGHLIDQMSYRQKNIYDTRWNYWDISATNGFKFNASESSLRSLQRSGVHISTQGVASLISDWTTGTPSPGNAEHLDEYKVPDFPITSENNDVAQDIDTSLPVGSLPGNATVSPTGAATYQIPIECPPGTNGLQPNLSIVYNSQGGQGLLGLGWDIAGLSAISRTPKSMYYDGENGKTIAFDNTDCLTLDGQRLILLSKDKENFAEGAVYGTEFENYSRVKVLKNSGVRSGDPNNHNFIYFELTTKEGTTMEFGSSPSSRVTSIDKLPDSENALSWKINRIIDVFGNTMEIRYMDNGQYVYEIKYVGSSRQIVNKIVFNYYDNTSTKYNIPVKKSTINGFWLQQNKILDNITTYNENKKVKTYAFNYIQSDRDLRLNTVATFTTGNKKSAETKINWGTENSKVSLVTLDKMADSNLNNVGNSTLYSGDIDGDGFNDKVELWTGNETEKKDGYIRVILKNKILESIPFNSTTKSYPSFKHQLTIGDINNDGLDEIILIERTNVKVLSYNNGTINHKDYPYNFSLSTMKEVLYKAMLIQCNDDEFLDLIILPFFNYFNSGIETYPEGGIFFGSKNYFSEIKGFNILENILNFYETPQTGDFNADGILDFMDLTIDKDANITYNKKDFTKILTTVWSKHLYDKSLIGNLKITHNSITPIDYNKDGLTDLLVQSNNKVKPKYGWYILKNNGGYNIEPTKIDLTDLNRINNVDTDENEHCISYTIDYNGDGYVDIIMGDEVFSKDTYQCTNWYFYKNVNGSFIADDTQQTHTRLSKMYPTTMDINNDGVQDLVFGSGDYYMAFTIPNGSNRYRVRSISNNLGQSDSFVYSTKTYGRTDSDIDGVININKSFILVTAHTDKNGTTTTYEYGTPKAHLKGKGFLGFETVSATNTRTDIKSKTSYGVNTHYWGFELKSQEVFAAAAPILLATLENKIVDGNSTTNPIEKGKTGINRFMPYVSSSIATDYKKGTSQTTTISAFDAYWNVTKQEEIMGDATKITETTYIKRNGQGIAYLPETINVTQQRTGVPDIVSETKYELYNAAGQVGKVTTYPLTDGEVITEYFYYTAGNLKEKKVTPKGLKAQSTTYEYDDYFRLCTSVKNALGQTARTTYDYATGNVKDKTDVNGFVTEYVYEEFGRLDKEKQPNGEEISYKTEWTNSYGATYKKTATSTKITNTGTSYFDKLGREIRTEQSGWKGKTMVASKEYNTKGQVEKATLPHYTDETGLYTEYEYNDILGRVTKEKVFDGKQTLTTQYAYTTTSTTITPPDATQKKTETRDKHGLVVERTDAGGTISYTYNAAGQPLTINSNGSKTVIEYDDYGNQKTLKDPNAGNISFTYYAGGLLKTQSNAKGDITEMVYDDYGRIDTKTITEKSTTKKTETKHSYVLTGNGLGQIATIELKENEQTVHKQTFGYNDNHQPETITDEYDNQTVVFSNTYDALWRPLTSTSPSGLTTTNDYNEYGDLYKISAGTKTLWEGNEQNSKGQFTNYTLGNGLTTTRTYSDRGEVESIRTYLPNSTTNVQNNTYSYYAKTGNLYTRNDLKNGRSERFEYDELDRLTKTYLNGVLKDDMSYYANGNINTKSNVGTYRYNTPRPHAMSGIDNTGAGVTDQKQFIDYTPFNKVSRIRQGIDETTINRVYDIFYGLDEQRIKTVYDDLSISGHIKTRYYFGSYEKEIDGDENITNIDYIYTPTGLTLIVKNGTQYYTHTDLLGSIERITNSTGAMVSEYAYTPWGGRILLSGVNITDRGYTGHEHLSPFGDDTNSGFCLINMNGRIYDPVLARFLSPDPYVQAPDFTQSFNRYAYCINNPFKYTDPTGEVFGWDDAIVMIVGGTINLISNWHDGISFGEGLSYFAIGAGAGIATYYAPGYAALIIGGAGSFNNLTSQSFQPDGSVSFKNIDWGQAAYSGVISGVTSYLGSQFGITLGADKWFKGIDSPLLQNVLRNVTTNTIVGGTLGGFGAISDNNPYTTFGSGAWSGIKMGAISGTISGIGAAAAYANDNKVNFLTGKSLSLTPNQKGQIGVRQAIWDIQNQGGEVLGTEVTFDVNGVRTRVDIVAKIDGVVTLIEVKNGTSASFTTNQKAAYKSLIIDQARPTPVGGNAIKAGLIIGQPLNNYGVRIIRYYE